MTFSTLNVFYREESLYSVIKKKNKKLWETLTKYIVSAPLNGKIIVISHVAFRQNISKRSQRTEEN